MLKKKRLILDPDLADLEGFEYSRHGLKSSTVHRNMIFSDKQQPNNLLSNKRMVSSKQQREKEEQQTNLNIYKPSDCEMKQSSLARSIKPMTDDENILSQKTIHKIATLALVHGPPGNVRTSNSKRKKGVDLKQIISKQKVNNLVSKFASKIERNISSAPPYEFNGYNNDDKDKIWSWEAFEPHKTLDNIFGLINIVLVFCLLFMSSLALTFKELEQNQLLTMTQFFSIFFFLIQIGYNSVTIKYKAGKKLTTLQEILNSYMKDHLIIDVVNLLIIVLDIQTENGIVDYFRLFIITKIPQSLEKLDKLEVSFIKNYYNEQYWSLVKVVLFNFCFAHVLAIFLSAMAQLDPADNWYRAKGISGQEWFPKYIWSYYWGVNIMLTVGFGDLAATNHREALCLIFIEIFSVMCLAYNINWIGTLISNIRSQDLEKGKNFKTFKQLSDKYGLPVELEWRISNYIEESVNIRKKFNIEEEHSFIQSLPVSMKKEYLKESNKSIFSQLPFFSNLVDKTLYNFAEKIEMSISHPEQFLRKIDDDYNLLILRQGEIGYTVKKPNCYFNEMIIDKVKISSNDRPFILGLEFLTRKRPLYETKSLEYSVIYRLSYDDMTNILRESQMDYLLFCLLRDKNRSIPDEFEVYSCQICGKGKKHTKFTCPKIHFVPFQQMVIHKQNHAAKVKKNKRVEDPFLRIQCERTNSLAFQKTLLDQLQELPCVHEKAATKKSKVNNAFIDKIKQIKRLKDTLDLDSYSEKVPDWIVKATSETIRKELERMLNPDKSGDEVWIINSDKAKNYKEYFPDSNSCNLEFTTRLDTRTEGSLNRSGERKKTIKIGSFFLGISSSELQPEYGSDQVNSSNASVNDQ